MGQHSSNVPAVFLALGKQTGKNRGFIISAGESETDQEKRVKPSIKQEQTCPVKANNIQNKTPEDET